MAWSCTRSLVTLVAAKALPLLLSVLVQNGSPGTPPAFLCATADTANCAGPASLTSSLREAFVDFQCCVSDFSLHFCLQEDYFNINVLC